MKKQRRSFSIVGGCSLIVIFAVVCLVVFAMLSLNTATAEKRLSERSSSSVIEYYIADCLANEILARIRNGEDIDLVEKNGDVYSYSCAISDTKELLVEVIIKNADEYSVTRWQVCPTDEWSPDDSIHVWDGN